MLDQGDAGDSGEKWLYSRYMLKIEPTGFSEGLDEIQMKKRSQRFLYYYQKSCWPFLLGHPSGRINLVAH